MFGLLSKRPRPLPEGPWFRGVTSKPRVLSRPIVISIAPSTGVVVSLSAAPATSLFGSHFEVCKGAACGPFGLVTSICPLCY